MITRRHFLESAALATAATTPLARALAPNPASDATPIVKTAAGPVSGYRTRAILAFKGIPYGADTRTTRFQAPKPAAPWTATRACIEWPTRAPQQSPDRGKPNAVAAGLDALQDAPVHYHLPPDQGTQSEDCLHLNVWTPALTSSKKRPVLFYIHGGAYNNGTVNADLYDGTRLAERGDVVVVTVNHRLNAFGYLYLAEIPGLADYKDSGNAGQLDLILALKWVRDNIASFGGDPANITIFGQSGGGAKCATLMAMPAAAGLFHKVLTMSGQQVWAAPKFLSTNRAKAALATAGLKGDITPAQLNALTMEQIQTASRTTPNWLPVLDGDTLPRDPFSPDAPPQSARIPMILGNTKDEIMGSTAWQRTNLTWDTLPAELTRNIALFKGSYSIAEIIQRYRGWYPTYTPVDVFTAAVAAFRSWPGQVIEAERRAVNSTSASRTWVYQFNFPSPVADGRAPHTEDLAFIFDNLSLSPGMIGDTPQDIAAAQLLATQMSSMLIAFARTGNPNIKGLPHWPTYDLTRRETMLFDRTSTIVSDPRGQERRMMVNAHYRQPGT